MKRIVISLLISFTCSSFAVAGSGTPEKAKPETTKAEAQTILRLLAFNFNSAKSIRNVMLLAGASQDSIKVVLADFAQKDLPKVELNEDEFFVGGKPTGIRITSYVPLNIRYGHRYYYPEKGKTLDQYYLSLLRFFESKSGESALGRIFEFRAQADPIRDGIGTPFRLVAGVLANFYIGGNNSNGKIWSLKKSGLALNNYLPAKGLPDSVTCPTDNPDQAIVLVYRDRFKKETQLKFSFEKDKMRVLHTDDSKKVYSDFTAADPKGDLKSAFDQCDSPVAAVLLMKNLKELFENDYDSIPNIPTIPQPQAPVAK